MRFSISTATVVMLVLLRLNVGWHFFSEGVKHYTDPHWTSEGFLRAARGPLAPLYHAYLPDFHGFEALLHDRPAENLSHAVQEWLDEIQTDWDGYRRQFSQHYDLNESQQKQAMRLLKDHQAKIREWGAENKDALATHTHEWHRKESIRGAPAGDLPFQKKRIAERQATLTGEASRWQAELKDYETDYHNELLAILDDDQRERSPISNRNATIDVVDSVMTYAILAIGLCLILGLFTRTACLAGAAFLLSVVLTQPFWISETRPTFNEFVEMFALLTLATTQVGRWCGLDFFLPSLSPGSCCAMKGKTDVSKS